MLHGTSNNSWLVEKGTYTGKAVNNTPQTTQADGVRVRKNGLRLYIVDSNSATPIIYQYNMTSAHDFDTLSYSKSLDTSSHIYPGTRGAFDFSTDGTYLYVLSSGATDYVRQWTLSTPFEIDSGSYSGSLTLSQDTNMYALCASRDATRFYTYGYQNHRIYQYNSLNGNIVTATYEQYIAAPHQWLTCFFSDPSGKRFYFGQTQDDYQYRAKMTTANDISTLDVMSNNYYLDLSVAPIYSVHGQNDISENGRYYYAFHNNFVYQYLIA